MSSRGQVLLVGATGFAGRHMRSAATEAGFDVVGTSRRPGACEVVCDLLDPASVDRAVKSAAPVRVVNLAGVASVSRSFREPAEAFRANALGTVNLLDAVARHATDAHVLCVSSGEVYGDVPASALPVTEERPPHPTSPYAVSKAAMELACDQYRISGGLRVAVARAFNHTGPGQSDSFVASSFARQVAEAEHGGQDVVILRTGDLSPTRDFSDVRDIARAYQLILEREIVGTFNVCSGRGTPLQQLVDLLGNATSLSIRTTVDASRVRPADPSVLYGSPQRLREETGWEARIPLAETLCDLLGWWRERVAA
jgi:GDP-4-dehydro-6-deoxy-D-mannose reductase